MMTDASTDIARLLPHAGRMCLLDGIDHWDEAGIVCRSSRHLVSGHPFVERGLLSPVFLVEYGAQAAAAHSRLTAPEQSAPQAGMLVAVRSVEFPDGAPTRVSAEHYEVRANAQLRSAAGLIYQIEVLTDGQCLLRGRISILLNAPADDADPAA